MNIKLVFSDWRNGAGESIYQTEKGISLTAGVFHSGTTFNAQIFLDGEDCRELEDILKLGFVPVFAAYLPNERGDKR